MLELNQRYHFQGQAVAWGSLGDGEPLILIHGTPFSSQVWRRIAPLLAGRHRVYFFDLLGYGASEKLEGQDVSLAVQNKLLAALIAEWAIEHPHILAHDFGGATALRGLYLNDLRYASLTLVDPVAIAPWGSPFVQHVREHETAFAGMPDYAHQALMDAYLQGSVHCKMTDEVLDIYRAPWTGTVGQGAFYRQVAQMKQDYTDEIEGRYGPLDIPVKLLWGAQDEWIPLDRGRKLADRLTKGKISVIPKAGHLVQEDAPEVIVAAMLGGGLP